MINDLNPVNPIDILIQQVNDLLNKESNHLDLLNKCLKTFERHTESLLSKKNLSQGSQSTFTISFFKQRTEEKEILIEGIKVLINIRQQIKAIFISHPALRFRPEIHEKIQDGLKKFLDNDVHESSFMSLLSPIEHQSSLASV